MIIECTRCKGDKFIDWPGGGTYRCPECSGKGSRYMREDLVEDYRDIKILNTEPK